MASEINDQVRQELVRLVADDYSRVTEFVGRLVGMRNALAALAVPFWAALLGIGFSNDKAEPFVVAAVVVLLLGVQDAYYSTLYGVLRVQCRRLERVLNANLKYCLRTAGKGVAAEELERSLEAVELGQVTPMRSASLKDLWRAFDLRTGVFAALAVAAGVLAFAVEHSEAPPVCFLGAGNAVLEADAPPALVDGDLVIVPCPDQ